jgi:hypothetical protein
MFNIHGKVPICPAIPWNIFLGISDNVQTEFKFEDVTDYHEAQYSPGFAHCVLTIQKVVIHSRLTELRN